MSVAIEVFDIIGQQRRALEGFLLDDTKKQGAQEGVIPYGPHHQTSTKLPGELSVTLGEAEVMIQSANNGAS